MTEPAPVYESVKFFCELCGEPKPVIIEPLQSDALNGSSIWGDVVCECSFVIATVTADEPGIYSVIKTSDIVTEPSLTEDDRAIDIQRRIGQVRTRIVALSAEYDSLCSQQQAELIAKRQNGKIHR